MIILGINLFWVYPIKNLLSFLENVPVRVPQRNRTNHIVIKKSILTPSWLETIYLTCFFLLLLL